MSMHSNWLSPVPKTSLPKVVVEKIKDAMINGELKPGDFLPSENELVSSLGVGKSSVREAVKMLEALGVVEIVKGQGSKIRTSIDSDVMDPLIFQLILQSGSQQEDLLEFRLMFETSASVLAMQHATEDDIRQLKQSCEKMARDFAAGITGPENDLNFHRLIYQGTHNAFVAHIGCTVTNLFRPSLKIANAVYPQEVLKDHRDILQALIDKDEKFMRQAIERSLTRWDSLVLNKGNESL